MTTTWRIWSHAGESCVGLEKMTPSRHQIIQRKFIFSTLENLATAGRIWRRPGEDGFDPEKMATLWRIWSRAGESCVGLEKMTSSRRRIIQRKFIFSTLENLAAAWRTLIQAPALCREPARHETRSRDLRDDRDFRDSRDNNANPCFLVPAVAAVPAVPVFGFPARRS